MDLKNAPKKLIGSKEDRAVSPVIGVVLMVAVTVILAAVIAAFVMGMGDDLGDGTPVNAVVDSSVDEDDDEISISLEDAGNAEEFKVRADANVFWDGEDDGSDDGEDEDAVDNTHRFEFDGVGATIDITDDEFVDDADDGDKYLHIGAEPGSQEDGAHVYGIGEPDDEEHDFEEVEFTVVALDGDEESIATDFTVEVAGAFAGDS